jgi:predicted acylesterase/phospholipase RssA
MKTSNMNSDAKPKIGLSLSGGGFRATLFHLGVVAAFRQLGRLREVGVVSCVSGGSIIGAHLVLNWHRYVSIDDATFNQAARELVAITTADVRGQIIRRLPLRRHRRFEHCLDRFLYSNALLTAIEGDERPILVLNATDLKHGAASAFIGGSFLPDVRKPELDDGTSTAIDVGPFSLASAVACSAAFPALFPERELSAKDFAQPRKKWEAGASLADGGVYDNLGIQFFLGSRGKVPPSAFYMSDAGAPFDYSAGLSGNVLSRAVRVTDVQMDLLRTAFIEDAADTPVPVRQISITDEPLNRQEYRREDLLSGIPPHEIVRRLQLIRTDLDEFTELEIDLLIRHGYTVAYKALTGGLVRTAAVTSVWSVTELGPPRSPATIQEQSTQLEKSQKRRLGLFNPKDRTFPVPWFLIAFAVLLLFATLKVLQPFVFESIRSPRVDQVLTGRPYRLTRVMRYVVLQPAAEREGHQGVLATSRFFYWTRLNQNLTPRDSTFTEVLIPTYERSPSVHGLGVIGANAIRESEGTLPFEDRQELTFQGARGDTLLLGTGVQYEFDWPGPTRSLENIEFANGEDYWAYENTSDYIDHLVIVVESRSDRLLVTQRSDCAILYRANRAIGLSGCRIGENNGAPRPGLTLYGGALVAEFNDLKPGDEAIIKYELAWR